MRYIQEESLSAIAASIDEQLHVVGAQLVSHLELYTMKPSTNEKRVSKSLEDGIIATPSSYTDNPFDMVTNQGRKAFINLVHTLNQVFPATDFSSMSPDSFTKEHSPQLVAEFLFSQFAGMPHGRDLMSQALAALDVAIGVKNCTIYSLSTGEGQDDVFGDESLWGWVFLFCNARTKKIAVFACRAVPFTSLVDEDGCPVSEGLFSVEEDSYLLI
ncbi:Maf1 regulator [Carpediemonas membranifera]|uniref:Maf1 regulator n=1 Tax=Carpediemonas membranifera TaxID=201153 RepID=A0A8J6E0P7_9EUKA|nr:Maf1 regulator [Carpediemonas membranifera]|eukprot:KAG9389617.1 Maf1 regulator [Carpediemonas membranifera]